MQISPGHHSLHYRLLRGSATAINCSFFEQKKEWSLILLTMSCHPKVKYSKILRGWWCQQGIFWGVSRVKSYLNQVTVWIELGWWRGLVWFDEAWRCGCVIEFMRAAGGTWCEGCYTFQGEMEWILSWPPGNACKSMHHFFYKWIHYRKSYCTEGKNLQLCPKHVTVANMLLKKW